MTSESAIVEEIEKDDFDQADNSDQTGTVDDQYDIEEPDDDDDGEFKVPVIDNLEDSDDDEKIPDSKDKTDTKLKAVVKTDDAAKEEKPEPNAQSEKVSDELVAKAKALGITEDDISLFKEPAQLEKLCSLIEPTVTEPKAEEQTKQTPEPADSEGDFKLNLDPDLYDPDLCKAMESAATEINGIKKALSQISGTMQRQSQEHFESNFESMIVGLGDDFTDVLGEGSLEKIGTDSDFYKNRCKLVEEMNAIASGYAQTQKTIPAPEKLFKRAVNGLFSDKIKSNTRKEVANQLERRSSQIISRPTGKKGKDSQTPEKRATTAVREKLREFGAYEETEIEEDF